MSLFNKIQQKVFKKFIDIFELTDNTSDYTIWRFTRYREEMKSETQLSAGKTKMSVFVNKRQSANVDNHARYTPTTNNMVLLTKPKEWESGFKLAFNVDVYFVNTKQFLNLPWDTENPIVIHYSDFNPIRLRTYGSYCFSAEQKPIVFIRNTPGIVGCTTSESITEQLNTFVINKFISFPEVVQIALGKSACRGVIGNVITYTQMQFA